VGRSTAITDRAAACLLNAVIQGRHVTGLGEAVAQTRGPEVRDSRIAASVSVYQRTATRLQRMQGVLNIPQRWVIHLFFGKRTAFCCAEDPMPGWQVLRDACQLFIGNVAAREGRHVGEEVVLPKSAQFSLLDQTHRLRSVDRLSAAT
jgi:hypothetical protein